MKRARIAWAGAVHDAVEADGRLELLTPAFRGRRVGFDEVVWLPPLAPINRPRTVLALGLNYADHAKELAFKAPEEPLAFVKGEALLGSSERLQPLHRCRQSNAVICRVNAPWLRLRGVSHGRSTITSTDEASPTENTPTSRPPASSAHAFVSPPVSTRSPASSR